VEREYRIRGEMVRRARLTRHMSQQKLAEVAGLSIGQISRIEGGKIDSPHFSTIKKLADALGLEAEELVEYFFEAVA
jgi:transcriptional regulator with XRE-family HTH domain